MSSQNQYRPTLVTCAGGLDFVTPKLAVETGKLNDCYNFEVADRLGYKRIDGIEPFDGRVGPSQVYSNIIYIRYTLVGAATHPPVGQYVKYADEKSPALGVVTKLYSFGAPTRYFMAVVVTDYNKLYALEPTDILSDLPGANSYTVVEVGGMDLVGSQAAYDTVTEQYDEYVNLYAALDSQVTSLPGARKIGSPVNYGPATSMKWYKDRLYVTQDASQLGFDNADTQIFPNDIIETASGTFQVLDLKLLEGSYGQGDGAGILLVIKLTGIFPASTIPAEITRNGSVVGTVDVASTKLAASYYEPWMGTLWRSKDIDQANGVYTDQGWESVDMGFTFDYKDGNDYGSPAGPPPLPGRELTATAVPVNSSTDPLTFSVGTTPNLGTFWTLEGGASSIPDAIALGDGVEFIRTTNSAAYGPGPLHTITVSAPDLTVIPEDAVLLGIEIIVRARATTADTPIRPQGINVKMSTANSVTKAASGLTTAFADYSVGGANDLWGSTGLDMATLRANTLSVELVPNYKDLFNGYTTDIDQVTIKIYYQVTVAQLFFWNGTDDVTATIVNYSIDDGTWAAGDAKGQMHVKGIIPVPPSDRTYISSGDEIRTAAGGLGDLVAVVSSDMVYAGVPSFEQMQAQDSRAQIIVANFYGNDDWEAMYAVTGAGRAWTYDGYYFRYLYTGLPLSKDLPRHIEFFKHHLALGYSSGNVTFSVEGEPLNFNGVDGAVSFDVGDRVTGLARMPGETFGVACESSWYGIAGTSIDDFSITILSPYEGAIEYTVVDCGKLMYCSYSGINTFDQTAAYGDFLGSRLSASIAPWLLPRLSGKAPALWYNQPDKTANASAISKKPAFAMAVRRKNQYRLWFEDGYILTMTLFGNEQIPVFTLSKIYDGNVLYDSDVPLVPFCHHTSVDSLGRERIHIGSYTPIDNPELVRFCYELDQGWLYRSGNAANKIHGNFTLTQNFYDNPLENKTSRKLRAHGMTKGRGQYKVAACTDYVSTFPDDLSDTKWQPISLPRDPVMGDYGPGDFMPATDMVDTAARGLNISFQVREVPVNQPPVIFQTLVFQSVSGKGDY